MTENRSWDAEEQIEAVIQAVLTKADENRRIFGCGRLNYDPRNPLWRSLPFEAADYVSEPQRALPDKSREKSSAADESVRQRLFR